MARIIQHRKCNLKRFSDFAADEINTLTGDKIKIEEILGKEIVVIGYKITDSK